MKPEPVDLRQLDGLYVGLLEDHEIAALNDAEKRGTAMRDYSGVGGIMGNAKVKVLRPEDFE